MAESRDTFLVLVVQAITQHPDWLASLILAIQGGVAAALKREREETANLAYALVSMIEAAPKVASHEKGHIQKGLASLAAFFEGAPVETDIRRLLVKDEEMWAKEHDELSAPVRDYDEQDEPCLRGEGLWNLFKQFAKTDPDIEEAGFICICPDGTGWIADGTGWEVVEFDSIEDGCRQLRIALHGENNVSPSPKLPMLDTDSATQPTIEYCPCCGTAIGVCEEDSGRTNSV